MTELEKAAFRLQRDLGEMILQRHHDAAGIADRHTKSELEESLIAFAEAFNNAAPCDRVISTKRKQHVRVIVKAESLARY
jgi:hypothetical protein